MIPFYAAGALVAGLTLFVGWRQTRQWLLKSAHPASWRCPHCGGETTRIHRRLFDRLIGVLFDVGIRRYRCRDEQCGWKGRKYYAR